MDQFAKRNPALAMIMANLLLGLNSVSAKIGFESIPPFLFSGIRYLSASLILLSAAHLAREQIRRKDYSNLAIQAVLQSVMAMSWYYALTLTQAINTSILFLLTPLMVYVGSVLILGEPRSNRALAGSLVAFSGGLLLFGAPAIGGNDTSAMLGNGLLIVAATALAALILHSKKIVTDRNIKSVLGFRWLATGLLVLLLSVTVEQPSDILQASLTSILALVFAITFAGAIGILLFYKALEHMRAEDSSSLFYIDTLAGATGGAVILGETLSPLAMLAAAIIIAGVIISHPVHIHRYMYFLKAQHSRFDDFLRWVKTEALEVKRLVERFF